MFLTPDAPLSSGTALFTHKELGIDAMPKANDETTGRINHIVGRDSQDYTKWEQTDFIANRFNRLALYRSNQFHAASNYFGDSLQNGRLIQTFFFDTGYFCIKPRKGTLACRYIVGINCSRRVVV